MIQYSLPKKFIPQHLFFNYIVVSLVHLQQQEQGAADSYENDIGKR